ncbi:MAG TPA: Atxe2 family lasso peptide isopeptidase [Allosphingosinicella sp.]|nr:Atxe2 family lasso peptide isopeptidase [Allosphingosinicella sp.]
MSVGFARVVPVGPGLRALRRVWREGWAGWPVAACLIAAPALAEPPPSPEEILEAADISGLAASPDGRHVAFRVDRASIARNSYDLAWQVADLETGAIRAVADGGEPIIADPGLLAAETPIWSPDGRWFYYRALRSGAVQIWRAAADGSGSAPVTAERGDVLSIERSADGRGIAYRVGPPSEEIEAAERAEYEAGILVDAHVELAQNVYRGAIINGRHTTQRLTGSWFARGGVLWSRPPLLRTIEFRTLVASDAGEADLAAAPAIAGAQAAPDSIARSVSGGIATARWTGNESLVEARRPGAGAPLSCLVAACRTARVAWLAWAPDGERVLFASSDAAHVQSLHVWDLRANEVRPLARSEGLLNGGRSESAPCAAAPSGAICVASGSASPPRLERVDLRTGARRPLYDPNEALRARHWPQAERLEWRSDEGRSFTGIVFLPEGAPRAAPLFINYYRCDGFFRGGVGDEWPFAAFASAGIAAACVNATPMSGPQDGVGQYRAAQGGVEALVALLAQRGLVDRARIGIGGLSFGSEVTMWMAVHSGLVAAASIASPQLEASSYWLNGVRGRDHHDLLRRVWGLGAPDETPERWRLLSPALNVERIHAPLLMQLPEQESRYAAELYARLSNSSTPVELYVFPDEAHIKAQPRHRLAAYRRNLDWFRFWLSGEESGDPRDVEQYRRWHELAARAR